VPAHGSGSESHRRRVEAGVRGTDRTPLRHLAGIALMLVLALAQPSPTAAMPTPPAATPSTTPSTAARTTRASFDNDRVPDVERLHYRWRLGGFIGSLAAIFLPSHGDGVLSIQPASEAELTTELLITSPESKDGEFWRYGSRVDRRSGQALEAWSAYRWRGEEKSKQEEISESGVLDVVSGIYSIRHRLPQSTEKLLIWSDGKIYPVEVLLRGFEKRQVSGKQLQTIHYTVRGDEEAEGRHWKGSLEIWLARDTAATLVELHIERSLASLKLELTDPPQR
jgi:Protein of unknown function (DUF3108)